MNAIQINKSKFKIGLLTSFLITALYPIGIFISLPVEDALSNLRHELSWSLFAVFFIPVGFGLMCSVISSEILSKIDSTMKILLSVIFSIGTVAIFFAVLDDAKGIPNPDRISSNIYNGTNFQEKALQIDRCLREEPNCLGYNVDTSFRFIKNCVTKTAGHFPKEIVSEIRSSIIEDDAEHFSDYNKRLSYECSLIEVASADNVKVIPSSIMRYIAITLNFVLVFYFWSFMWMSGIYFAYGRKEVGKPTVHVLLGSAIILITWFPLRMYATWHEWYYTLYQLKFYDAFWGLLVFAAILFVLYLIWSISLNLNVSMFIAIPAVHSALALIFGILIKIEPTILRYIFQVYENLSWSILLVGLCGILFFVTTYVKSLIEQE